MQSSGIKNDHSLQIQLTQFSSSKQAKLDRLSLKKNLNPSQSNALYEAKPQQGQTKQTKKEALIKSMLVFKNPILHPQTKQNVMEKSDLEDKKKSEEAKDIQRSSMMPLVSKIKETRDNDKQIISRFNPYKTPPNLDDCLFHQAATQFGTPLQRNLSEYKKVQQKPSIRANQPSNRNSDSQNPTSQEPQAQRPIFTDKHRCQCCGEQPKQKLPVFCRLQDIYKVNSSLGFYFTYIKVMIVMLLIAALSLGTYSTIRVITNCDTSSNCIYIYGIPVERFYVFFNSTTDIIAGSVICLMYFFAVYLYYTNAFQHRKVFLDVNKPSNFSVLISNVDHSKVSGQAILDHFKEYDIVDVLYVHQIKQYLQKLQEKQLYLAQKRLLQKKSQKKNFSKRIAKIQRKIDDINSYLFQIKKKLTLNVQKEVRTDKIIIKFRTIEQKIHFQQKYKTNFAQFFVNTICNKSQIEINQNKMHLEHLGEPYEILWENFEIGSRKRLCRTIVGTILTLVVLGGSFVFAAVVIRLENLNSALTSGIISLIFSAGVSFINFILEEIIERLTEWQKRYTLTSKYRIMVIKNFLAYFLNTTLMPFFFFALSWSNTDEDTLLRNIFSLFILTNIQLPIVAYFIEGDILVKKFMRWFIKRQGEEGLVNQVQANKHFQKYDFKLNLKFGKVLQSVANALFYAAFFPIGMVITLIALLIRFWSSKIFLLNFCTITKQSYRLVFFPCILGFGYAFNSLMISGTNGFNRVIPFIIAALTVPVSILFLAYGSRLAQKMVEKQYRGLHQNRQRYMNDEKIDKQINHVADYRELNPTSYIHLEVHDHVNQTEFETMWGHVMDYAKDQGKRN